MRKLQTGLGNAAFMRLFDEPEPDQGNGAKGPSPTIMRTLGNRGAGHIQASPATLLQRQPAAEAKAPAATQAPRAEDIVQARYPQLVSAMKPGDFKAIQDMIDWRLGGQHLNQEIADFDKRERQKQERAGWAEPGSNSYQFTSAYQDKLERLQHKRKDPPKIDRIELDTTKLIDRGILDPQPWNVAAEKDFRERWVVKLASVPTVLDLTGKYPIEDGFRGPFWNGVALPTEGGLITWKKLLELEQAGDDYQKTVRYGPFVKAVLDAFGKVTSLLGTFSDEYNFEVDRKSEFRHVSWVAEHLSSEIDFNAAAKFLPKGKSFSDMTPYEIIEFLDGLTEDQMKQVATRVLPAWEDYMKLEKHWNSISAALDGGKYEAGLMAISSLADEIEWNLYKVRGYHARTVEGASVAVKGLIVVREACHLAVTVMGGMVGGKVVEGGSRLAGVALGSAGRRRPSRWWTRSRRAITIRARFSARAARTRSSPSLPPTSAAAWQKNSRWRWTPAWWSTSRSSAREPASS